jgi:outer membrane protein TolC
MKDTSRTCDSTKRIGPRRRLCLFLLVTFLVAVGGCTRYFYRNQADKEVNDILAEKDKFPAWWKIEQYHVYPDPRARFADPTNPDRPPMPPDDETAYKLSPHPQAPGHAGVGTVAGTAYLEMIKVWDEQNRAEREAESQRADAEHTDGGAGTSPERIRGPIKILFDEPLTAQLKGFLLKLDQAVELGVINSRQYQNFREGLYEAALPVTLQRYSFAYQWTATETAVRQWAGPLSLIGEKNSWNLGSTIGFSKLFSTGALLTSSFANSVVFNFTGPTGFSTSSIFNLNLVQPLLQGGGRAITLEPLTQAERNLVYSIRAYARFRSQFYVSVAIGASPPNSLVAAVGTTSGLGAGPISALAALGIASTDVSGGFVGYLSTLFREVDMAADKKYVQDLQKAIKLFEGLQEGGQVSPLQVLQVRSTLLQAQNTVLTDQQFVNNALDQFKLVLGVPTNLPLLLDDAPCRDLTRQLDRYYEVIGDADAAYKLVENQDQLAPEKLRPFLLQLYTQDVLVRGTAFQKKLPLSWAVWAKLTDEEVKTRLEKLGKQRRELLDAKTEIEMKGKTLSEDQLRTLNDAEFESDVGGLEQILRRYEARPWEKLKGEQSRLDRLKLFRLVAYQSQIVLVWARNERIAKISELWPVPPSAPLDNLDLLTADVDQAQQLAVQAALTERVDLMNARAQVVDAWRQVRVTANALLGVLNVGYNLVSQSRPGSTQPFSFSTDTTQQQLSLNFQFPLNRLAQRNDYRTALINFQQARRNLMALEDSIAAPVRFDVRQLQLFYANYKIQQQVLQSLYSQVENALEVIVAPVDPDQLKQTGTTGQANAAALTSQYLTALGQLNGAQTKMYDIWLSLLATRMQLYLDLERMRVDNRGVWIEDFGSSPCGPAQQPLAPARVAGNTANPVANGPPQQLPDTLPVSLGFETVPEGPILVPPR